MQKATGWGQEDGKHRCPLMHKDMQVHMHSADMDSKPQLVLRPCSTRSMMEFTYLQFVPEYLPAQRLLAYKRFNFILPTLQIYRLAQGVGRSLRKNGLLTYCASFWGRLGRGSRYEENICILTWWDLDILQDQTSVSGWLNTNWRHLKNICMLRQS